MPSLLFPMQICLYTKYESQLFHYHAKSPDIVLKGVTVLGTVFHLRTVVVDGLWGIEEKIGYFRTVADAKPDECEDSQVCGQRSGLLGIDLLAITQQIIELVNKCWIQSKESIVETMIENVGILCGEP